MTETATITDLLMRYGVREYDITESTNGDVEVMLADSGIVTIEPTGEGDGWTLLVHGPGHVLDREDWVTDRDWLAREVAQLVRLTART